MNSISLPGAAKKSAVRYLDPSEIRVFRTPDGRVRVAIGCERTVLAPRFLRVFALTDPDRYLSIREGGPQGREVGLLRDWKGLDRDSRELVQAELDRRYLYPVVRRVASLEPLGDVVICVFETDRGTRQLTLREIRENITYLGETRALLTDAEGNRYDIPNVAALDQASRSLLAQIL